MLTSLRSTLALPLVMLLMSGCASLPDNSNNTPSYAIAPGDTETSQLGKSATQFRQGQGNKTGAYLLSTGLDGFAARGVLANAAEKSLDVQYYLYHNDDTGLSLTKLLLDAAERGVKVRILVDDMDLNNRDGGVAGLNTHPNIEIRIFNPFSRNTFRLTQMLSRFGSVTRRMHNKTFIADNQFAIVGGRNVGDEYFDVNPDNAFGDLDALVVGPAVSEISTSFD